MKDNENRLYKIKEEVLDALETAADNNALTRLTKADPPFGFGEIGNRIISATLEMVCDYLVYHPDADSILTDIAECRNQIQQEDG